MLCVEPDAVADSTNTVHPASEYNEIVSPEVTGESSIVGVSTLPGFVAGLVRVIEVIIISGLKIISAQLDNNFFDQGI